MAQAKFVGRHAPSASSHGHQGSLHGSSLRLSSFCASSEHQAQQEEADLPHEPPWQHAQAAGKFQLETGQAVEGLASAPTRPEAHVSWQARAS